MFVRFAAAACLSAMMFAPAMAADPYVVVPAPTYRVAPAPAPVAGPLPACADQKVVNAALKFTNSAEPVYRVERVAAIDNVFEQKLDVDNPSPLARRYCSGRAVFEDGRVTTAYIRLEEQGGFAGFGWSVNVCLEDYDKWRVYDGFCRTARPAPDR
ncbi:hypothetical protein [Amorphus sp. MBR-141]